MKETSPAAIPQAQKADPVNLTSRPSEGEPAARRANRIYMRLCWLERGLSIDIKEFGEDIRSMLTDASAPSTAQPAVQGEARALMWKTLAEAFTRSADWLDKGLLHGPARTHPLVGTGDYRLASEGLQLLAALAALPVEPSPVQAKPIDEAWLPIETAPRDGTRFLASDGRVVRLVRWADEHDRLPIGDEPGGVWPSLPHWWQPLPPLPVPPVGCAEAQKQDKPEPGAQAKVQPEPRESIASRQVGRIERELEDFCLWLIESGLQWVANELASRVVILPSGSVAEASKRDEPNPVPAPATPAAQGVPDTAMEVLRELVRCLDDEPRPFATRRTEWVRHLNNLLIRARTLTSASDAAPAGQNGSQP
jgi:hypothetical protein